MHCILYLQETGHTIKLKSGPEKGEDERVSPSHQNTTKL